MAKCNANRQHCPQMQQCWGVHFIGCELVAIVWAFCDTNKWGQTDLPHGRRPSSPSVRSTEPSRSARAVTEPRCPLQLSQSFWWQKAHRARQYSEGGRVGNSMLWREEEEYQGVSKTPGLISWCIKRYRTSSDHTTNTTLWVLRLLCAVQRAHCWRSCPGLRRRDRRRSGCRESRCGWCTATQSDSSWCREPQPRCGRRRCMRTGSPRAEQRGYRRQQTRCGSTSTWTQWRWCSWASTPHPGCVCR